MKQGLFYPELTLGADSLSYPRRKEIRDFFVELIRQRGFPLHVANLWNALYFSWDLDERGYVAATINPDRIAQREMNQRDFALPIGGFVRVLTPTKVGELWAEVVYKEWAHPEVTAVWVPDWLSGAPADDEEFAGDPVAVARERLVLDLNAFGPGFNDVTPVRYQRLLHRGRWLDEHGHLVMKAMYPPEEANLDDLDFYAHYLLTNHPEGLLAFCFREDPSQEELREALLRSLDAVRQVASACDELDGWRDKYFFDRTTFDLKWRDESVDAVFGADDLRSIFRCLSRVPRRVHAVYNAVGPQVLELLDRHGDLAEEEGALVRGPAYAAAVCYANAYVRDRLRNEASEGLLASGCHLRLDDDRQAGGIWRCERIEDYSSLTTIPPTIPLHLGYGEAHPDSGLGFADTEPEPITTSVHGFRVALTKRDLSLGRLRLPERVVQVLGATGKFVLRLRHEGEQDDQDVSLGPGGRTLIGTTWPLSFFPGLILHCNVERGGTVVKARTKELLHPVTIDDVELRYEFDEAVYRRETKEQLPKDELNKAPTLNDLVHRAFRDRGRQTEDGGRTLTGTEIITVILGPGWKPGEARPVMAALQQLGLENRQGEYLWRPRVTSRTSASDRAVLGAYWEKGSRRKLSSIIRRHLVPMHLRRLRGKHRRPSAEKVNGYANARRRFGFQGVLPPDLPHGYTWVEPYERGGHVEEALGAEH